MMRRPSQRGVAVVTALLLTALSVTLVAGIFWQQQIMVRGMEGQRLRLQARLIARGALDAARLRLLESAAAQGNVTTLDGAWSVPMFESRLERFLGQEDAQGQGGALAQQIADAQASFNLRNLVAARQGGIDLYQTTAFARLLAALNLNPALAYRIAEAMAGAPLEVLQLDDLRGVPGLDGQVLARLRAFVVVLPAPTPVNVNTAPPEVLTAVANLSLAEARVLAGRRRQAHFKGLSDFAFRLNDRETLEGVDYAVTSDYFLVRSTLTLARATLHSEALVRRGGAALVWVHDD
ncbi:type II secretion system minor pseudopilin GspK [Duganella callida]|uniref:Type II secretion system protein K n=1 Tax=Duganella callida TaxID=2561932 RepID=A0A4Y9SH35_9BURK|nr:type II secretion system minor pseudopilin GspK [Duganella callida]TFW20969.1 general secretion pathway protein GspK [Duganella callida]